MQYFLQRRQVARRKFDRLASPPRQVMQPAFHVGAIEVLARADVEPAFDRGGTYAVRDSQGRVERWALSGRIGVVALHLPAKAKLRRHQIGKILAAQLPV